MKMVKAIFIWICSILLCVVLTGISLGMYSPRAIITLWKNEFTIVFLCALILALVLYHINNEDKYYRVYIHLRLGKHKLRIGLSEVYKKYANNICLVVGAMAVVALAINAADIDDNTIDSNHEFLAVYPIAHALGAVDGYTYTNSLEAFETNYASGHRIFEVDMQLTSDGELVCWHGWGYNWDGIAPSKEEFLEEKIEGKYTALSIEDVICLMDEYDDIYIVTDTKDTDLDIIEEQFKQILDVALELDEEDVLSRFIVQVYSIDMYNMVKSVYEFKQYIYTLYNNSGWSGEEEDVVKYLKACRENNIRYLTIRYDQATSVIIEMAEMCDVKILVHTVNDLEEAEDLLKMGVLNIYTDDISPDMLLE